MHNLERERIGPILQALAGIAGGLILAIPVILILVVLGVDFFTGSLIAGLAYPIGVAAKRVLNPPMMCIISKNIHIEELLDAHEHRY